jgi:hypothetical protein
MLADGEAVHVVMNSQGRARTFPPEYARCCATRRGLRKSRTVLEQLKRGDYYGIGRNCQLMQTCLDSHLRQGVDDLSH